MPWCIDGAERFGGMRVVDGEGMRAEIHRGSGFIVCDGVDSIRPIAESGRASVVRQKVG